MTLEELQLLRLWLHRLEPARPIRDIRLAAAFVRERGLVMETGRSSLPVLAEAIAGRHIRGSWMADREVYRIHRLMNAIRKHGVLAVPLVDGKETLLTARLGPAVERVATDQARCERERDALPPLAGQLLSDVEREGEVRMDRWLGPLEPTRRARLLLVRKLLVWSRSVHTERGYHTAVVIPWRESAFSRRFARAAARLPLDQIERTLLGAALRSAVVAPEREVRRWFVFGSGPLDSMIQEGLIRRLQAGRFSHLMITGKIRVRSR